MSGEGVQVRFQEPREGFEIDKCGVVGGRGVRDERLYATPFSTVAGEGAGCIEGRNSDRIKRGVSLLRKDHLEWVVRGEGEAAGGAFCVLYFVGTGGGIDVASVRNIDADGGVGVVGEAGTFHGAAEDFRKGPGLAGGLVEGVAGDFGGIGLSGVADKVFVRDGAWNGVIWMSLVL